MKHLLWLTLTCLCAPALAQTVAEDMKAAERLVAEDRPVEAVKHYDHILAHKPGDLKALYGRGVTFAQMHKSAEAEKDLTVVVSFGPREPFARYWRGVAFNQQQKRTEAIEDFSVALGTNEPLPTALQYAAYVYRGLSYNGLGRLAEARADLDAAVKLDPTQADAWAGRARVRRAQGDEAGAQSDLAEAAKIDPDLGQLLDSDSAISLSRIILWGVIAAICGLVLLAMAPLFRALAVLTKEEKAGAGPANDADTES